MITIYFFGRVSDLVGKRKIEIPASISGDNLFALRDQLFAGIDANVKTLRMSLNKEVIREDMPVGDGDEIAFFSVFSGG